MSGPVRGAFDLLAPDAVIAAVEGSYGCTLDGTIVPYPSYVNRVYGLMADGAPDSTGPSGFSGTAAGVPDRGDAPVPLVAKFYRPRRWSAEAILEEHRFILDCARAEIPVAVPIANTDGETLSAVTVEEDGREEDYCFALFPRMGGRSFDTDADGDWERLGAIAGRIHAAGDGGTGPAAAAHRSVLRPDTLTAGFAGELLAAGLVHPELKDEFGDLVRGVLARIAPEFEGVPLIRTHGDLHRGNILDRPGEGLFVIDFDDMMLAPAVQDLWLLLPDRADKSRRELELLLSGYERFMPFDRRTLSLIEPLRFMRMVYYLAWQARQRDDLGFRRDNPDWGTRPFWIRTVEDLRDQAAVIAERE